MKGFQKPQRENRRERKGQSNRSAGDGGSARSEKPDLTQKNLT
jgi:hypothetical protein